MTKKKVVNEVKVVGVIKGSDLKISSEKVSERPPFEKAVYKNTPTSSGDVRVIVLQDYNGMLNELRAGDIIDMPERRFKSLSSRGLVKEYKGRELPNKQR